MMENMLPEPAGRPAIFYAGCVALCLSAAVAGGLIGSQMQMLCYDGVDGILPHLHTPETNRVLFGGVSGGFMCLIVAIKGAYTGGVAAFAFALSFSLRRRVARWVCLVALVLCLLPLPGVTESRHVLMLFYTFPLLCAAVLCGRGAWLLRK